MVGFFRKPGFDHFAAQSALITAGSLRSSFVTGALNDEAAYRQAAVQVAALYLPPTRHQEKNESVAAQQAVTGLQEAS
jgi:hypothetical protein